MKIPFKALNFEESVNVYLGILRENTRVAGKFMRERRGRTQDEEIEGGGNGFLVLLVLVLVVLGKNTRVFGFWFSIGAYSLLPGNFSYPKCDRFA